MNVKTPVIGIPHYWWHKKVFKYAKKNPNLIEMDTKDLCYECHRHLKLLKYIDGGYKSFRNSEYWMYYQGKKNAIVINNKINRYKKLYDKIKKYGYVPFENTSSIIITDDGCRIDGSHRLAILQHIRIEKVMVNVFSYEDVFTAKESRVIRTINECYRKETYNL